MLEKKLCLAIVLSSIGFTSLTSSWAGHSAIAKEKLDNDNVAGDEYSDPRLRPEILPSGETSLPTKPEDVKETSPQDPPGKPVGNDLRAPISTEPKQQAVPLQGGASITNIGSRAELMAGTPLSRYRGNKLVFYRVEIRNNGSTPLLVLGKDVQIGGVKNLSAATLEKHDNVLLTPKEKALVTAVGVGSAGLASSLFYEHMTPSENKNRSLGIALGRDRGRHEVEAENLGTRLIMPGDQTSGWVAFEDCGALPADRTISVPVMFPPYSATAGTLQIPVSTAIPTPDKPVKTN